MRAEDFDVELFCQGYDAILRKLDEIEAKGFQATAEGESDGFRFWRWRLEMTARGFSFKPIDLYRSDATRLLSTATRLFRRSPLSGIGENAARILRRRRMKESSCRSKTSRCDPRLRRRSSRFLAGWAVSGIAGIESVVAYSKQLNAASVGNTACLANDSECYGIIFIGNN